MPLGRGEEGIYSVWAQIGHGQSEPLCCLKTGSVKDFSCERVSFRGPEDKIVVQDSKLNLSPDLFPFSVYKAFNQEKLNWLKTLYLHPNL